MVHFTHTPNDRLARGHSLRSALIGMALTVLAMLNACGGGGSTPPQATGPATLSLTITGLGTLAGDVTVTGPNDYTSGKLSGGTTLTGLTAGVYTITATTVTDPSQPGLGRGNGGTLGPEFLQRYPYQAVQTLSVAAGANVSVNVDYPAATQTFALPTLANPMHTVPLELVFMPGGTFIMGSPDTEPDRVSYEGPQHAVTLTSFSMATFETTQAQWLALMGSNPSYFYEDLNRPVEQVSWNDITLVGGFLDKLNAATAATRPAGMVFRLPTEAEWEYAARARTTTRFYWGDDPSYSQIGDYVWYLYNCWDVEYGSTTHPVGEMLPNAFGLYDMTGNIWEFCQDWHGAYGSTAQTDPAGPKSGSYRALRGGSIDDYPFDCRSALRNGTTPNYRLFIEGFRVVLGFPRTP